MNLGLDGVLADLVENGLLVLTNSLARSLEFSQLATDGTGLLHTHILREMLLSSKGQL
jgi:hypothetical protein